MPGYEYQPFDVVKPPELGGPGSAPDRYPVAIIGAGPIGLTAAIDLATRGISSVVLDDNDVVSIGSRAICWAKRTLEIFDRLGVGERMLEKGVTWKTGRLFHKDQEVYNFDLLPEDGHHYPAFINLQQYYVEQYLVERAGDFPDMIDLRFRNRVIGHMDHGDRISVQVETPFGAYALEADYVLACDGANSPTRRRMDLPFEGETFEEHFLIADVEMEESPFATDEPERWFWFEPPFHHGQSSLLHKQPDNIYRIDLQLGPDADPSTEATEEKVFPRIKAMVGNKPFKLDWMSVYKFRCARLQRFVHNRVIFVGDSAHVVSPFGARGGNGGIQDVDNLCWKLAAVLKGNAPVSLIETYNEERVHGSNENILNSARATNFMTPKSPVEHMFRNEVLNLSCTLPFARKLINSGRLSTPCSLSGMSLQTPSPIPHPAMVGVGQPVLDAPLLGKQGESFMIREVQRGLSLVGFGDVALPRIDGLFRIGIGTRTTDYPCFEDPSGLAKERYGDGLAYLFRPDGHVAAIFENPNSENIRAAIARLHANSQLREVA